MPKEHEAVEEAVEDTPRKRCHNKVNRQQQKTRGNKIWVKGSQVTTRDSIHFWESASCHYCGSYNIIVDKFAQEVGEGKIGYLESNMEKFGTLCVNSMAFHYLCITCGELAGVVRYVSFSDKIY